MSCGCSCDERVIEWQRSVLRRKQHLIKRLHEQRDTGKGSASSSGRDFGIPTVESVLSLGHGSGVRIDPLSHAERVAPVRTVSDYSYASREFAGDGWLLVGDAAAFIDPVFSTGVCLGMGEAFRAAEAVERALARRDTSRRAFRDYERFVTRAVETYGGFVKGFYTPEFVELLMHPSDRFELRRGITALLAGHALERFDVVWRSWLFRGLARANRLVELVPRIPERRPRVP